MTATDDRYPESFPPPSDSEQLQLNDVPTSQRPLLPIYPPPQDKLVNPPQLPSRSTTDDLQRIITEYGFVFSSHIVPACYLRSGKRVTLPTPEYGKMTTKDERKRENERVYEEMWNLRKEFTEKNSTGNGQEDRFESVLWNVANRFTNVNSRETGRRKGLTLFFAHANGFCKEKLWNWETTISHILFSPASRAMIYEIWVFDAIQHGDSALLNKDVLPHNGIFNWTDNTRDILNFLLHYLPPPSSSNPLPTHLHPQLEQITTIRKSFGFQNADSRTLVVCGHSFGGCASAIAATHYPSLFSSLVLVDPIIIRPGHYEETKDRHLDIISKSALGRRDEWASRDECRAQFLKNPFFRAWDPDVLSSYINHALTTTNPVSTDTSQRNETVTLKMSPLQECNLFTEYYASYLAYARLPHLPDSVELFWIMPGQGKELRGGLRETHCRVWIRPKNSSNVRIDGAGHLITHEAPQKLGEAISLFLQRKYAGAFKCRVLKGRL